MDKIVNPFGLTEKDLRGDLEGFPMGIVVRMMEEQENQGNKPDIKVFQRNTTSDKHQGGFRWLDTEDGQDFWSKVLYSIPVSSTYFFEKHPEYKKYNL